MTHMVIDFGKIDWDINGLIGLDILATGRFVIDLYAMDIYQKGNR